MVCMRVKGRAGLRSNGVEISDWNRDDQGCSDSKVMIIRHTSGLFWARRWKHHPPALTHRHHRVSSFVVVARCWSWADPQKSAVERHSNAWYKTVNCNYAETINWQEGRS